MTDIDFIGVMRRDDTREMLSLMETYYSKYFGIPGWTEDESVLPDKKSMVMAAHDMIRLASSIASPARDLLREISNLEMEICKLKGRFKSSNNTINHKDAEAMYQDIRKMLPKDIKLLNKMAVSDER